MMRNYVVKSKYVLGTQYLRQIVVESFDKHTFLTFLTVVTCWFQVPANAEGILEVVEAFTYDGGNLMRDGMEERNDAVRTYVKEFLSVLRALDDHWDEAQSCARCVNWIRAMMRTRQVQEYGDDTYIKVIVKAYMEHNGRLLDGTGKSFEEYRKAMKPLYKYRWYYVQGRENRK